MALELTSQLIAHLLVEPALLGHLGLGVPAHGVGALAERGRLPGGAWDLQRQETDWRQERRGGEEHNTTQQSGDSFACF